MVTICIIAIFKNECHILKEFITHYLNQGVDHFLFIDNGSNDGYFNILEYYINNNIVTLQIDSKKGAQIELYNKYYLEKCKIYDWVIICDLDEFIYARRNFKSIKEYLNTLNDSISQVVIPWKTFGSSGFNTLEKKQPDSVIKNFIKRANYNNNLGFVERTAKSIVKTQYLTYICIHLHGISNNNNIGPDYSSNNICNYVFNLNNIVANNETSLSTDFLHLNHYRIQSYDWFMRVKVTRGDAFETSRDSGRNEHYYKRIDELSNDIDDFELFNINKYFDWEYYLDTYPDLRANGIYTEKQALEHWNFYGKKEGRCSCKEK